MPILIYGAETWTITKGHEGKLTTIEMRFLRMIENKTFRKYLKIKSQLRKDGRRAVTVYVHVKGIPDNNIIKQVFEAEPGRPE